MRECKEQRGEDEREEAREKVETESGERVQASYAWNAAHPQRNWQNLMLR